MLLFWLKIPWIIVYNQLALAKFERLGVWSVVICRKRMLFEIQFHLMKHVVSTFLQTWGV